jgi:ribosomal protein S18 acetylase RimI-like enzyme
MCTIRPATAADNHQLLELTRLTPMPGSIGLRIDRGPDFFRLLTLRGEGSVFVAEEGERLLGCIAVSRRRVWVAGEVQTLWYVGDLKVHPDHRGQGIAGGVVGAGFEYIVDQGVDLLLCVVAAGNRRVVSFLEGRYQVPPFRRVASLNVLQILASRGRIGGFFRGQRKDAAVRPFSQAGSGRPGVAPACAGGYHVRIATPEDAATLAALHGEMARRYQLAPELTAGEWEDLIAMDPTICQVLVAEADGAVQAATCLLDGQWAKQHVVVSLPRTISLVAGLLRPLGALSPAFRLPRTGETISMLFLRHLVVRDYQVAGLRALVQASRRRAHEMGYPVVVYGLHPDDPHRAAFRGMPRFSMGSELFLTSVQGNSELLAVVAEGIPVEDYAVA